ncbi:mRNA capping enzyme [Panaeolus papilionaceus]|nr:mRNA capping enzyme [Panaeolus papilionaceus]
MHRRDDQPPPMKRARQDSSSQDMRENSNGHAQGSQMTLPPLSLSILGVEPLDEFIKEVADFVHHMIMTRPLADVAPHARVEVEAKIGILKDKGTGTRYSLPVCVETILHPGADVRFESNMTVNQHRHYNNLLNNLKATSTQPNHPSTPLDYAHHYLVDNFFPPSADQGPQLGHPYDREKIRVTRDEKTGNVLESVRKIRLGDLNILSPKREADWRISVNLEVPMPHPVGVATHKRRKDRLSYSHEEFVIDLTQVTSSMPNEPPQILHELELEIARPELLLSSAAKRFDASASETEKAAFDELIRAFVNNARILVRNSSEGWQ